MFPKKRISLLEKNPEKKAFFAGRINYINSKTNL